jgi:predicted kinase
MSAAQTPIQTALLSAVVVLVGPPAAGKTTVRRRLVNAGLSPSQVVSLDDLRRAARSRAVAEGGTVRPLQDYTLTALREADHRQEQLLTAGLGYVADATHLRRRERVVHVRAAHAAGLPALAVLLPDLPLDTLRTRDALRPADERVPGDALAAFAHRRSLLTADLLRGEGFMQVYDSLAELDVVALSARGPGHNVELGA